MDKPITYCHKIKLRLLGLLIAMLCALNITAQVQDNEQPVEDNLQEPAPSSVIGTNKLDSFYLLRKIDVREAVNLELYNEIFKWYHTCYKWGGNNKKGIDCSHFVNMLCEKIYGVKAGYSAGDIMQQCKLMKNGLKHAKEGDILFFKIKKGQVSHVGIYLQNGKFAHASVHNGVVISDIEEPYYKHRFYKVGRLKTDKS